MSFDGGKRPQRKASHTAYSRYLTLVTLVSALQPVASRDRLTSIVVFARSAADLAIPSCSLAGHEAEIGGWS